MPLKAFRFRYDEVLEACLDGSHTLRVSDPAGPFETGRHIRKIQQALLDVGIPLPTRGADSVYGSETATAVSQLKTEQGIVPNDGVVGPKTMAALDAIFSDEVSFPTPAIGQGEMTLDDLIEAVQAAEQVNGVDTTDEFITRLRQLYYPGVDPDGLTFREVAFDHLLPDAPFKAPDGSRRVLTPAGMDSIFFGRLSMRAPENPTPGHPLDNPSPYFYDTTATRVDLGHVILTIDAILHPRADVPYADFGIPAIDVASWVADLGMAAVWAEQDGVPDAPRVLPRNPDGGADLDGYYQMAAPATDLIGDIDGFNIAASMLVGESLSATMIKYYVDGETKPGIYRQRFRMFLAALLGTANPDKAALAAAVTAWTPRVDRFNDLFAMGPFDALFTLKPPPPRKWMFTSDVIAKFLQMLTAQLAIETDRFD